MDETDLLNDQCKGNRKKFESMKRKLSAAGRSRKDPDMESDAEDNMQYKPLDKDVYNSESCEEQV